MPSPRVSIDGSTVQWARATAGLDVESAAKKIGVSPERLREWEASPKAAPTVKQLRKLAHVLHRPIGLFFLPALPEEPESIRDFRRVVGSGARSTSAALRFEIRLARERRQEALELIADLKQQPTEFRDRCSSDDDPDQVAARLRARLRVDLGEQTGWQSKYDGFNSWRAAIERLGVLVFQTGATASLRVDPNEARGFSVAEQPFPVIVVNGGDRPTARSFTLIHELSHLLLRNGGLCDFHHVDVPRSDVDRVEVFCNRVAGAVLVPAEDLLRVDLVRRHGRSATWSDSELSALAHRYWVSWEVVLRRLLMLGHTTKEFYEQWREGRADRYPEREDSGEPHLKTPIRVVRRHGRLFPSLVLAGYDESVLTAHEAAAYLNAGPQHLDEIREEVQESRYAV